jgi:DNA repair protein RadC
VFLNEKDHLMVKHVSSTRSTSYALPLSLWNGSQTSPETIQESHSARLLREALKPYISLPDLRRLAATDAASLHDLLTPDGKVPPEEVQALLRALIIMLQPAPDESIMNPDDLAALLMVEMGHLDHEEFWQVCLDTKHHVQRLHCLYKGSLNSSVVRVGEVFRLPLLLNSESIIIAHCHPSGSTTPSTEDIEVTRLLIQAGKLLEIEVLDHLIIGRGRWVSLREQRLAWEG